MDRGTKMTLSRKTTPPTVGVKYSVPYWLCPAPRISMLIIALHLMRVLFDSLAGPRLPSTLRFGEGRANNHTGQNILRLRSPGPPSFRTPKAAQPTHVAQQHFGGVDKRKDKKPRETSNNNIMIKIGPKTIGGPTAMPPQNNHNGAKTVAGLRITMIGLPKATPIVSYPGWNPGTPLTSAKILST